MEKLCKNCAHLDENYNCEEEQFKDIQIILADLDNPTDYMIDLSRACKFFYPKLDCRNCLHYKITELNNDNYCNCIKGYLEAKKRYDRIFTIDKEEHITLLNNLDLEIIAQNCKEFR